MPGYMTAQQYNRLLGFGGLGDLGLTAAEKQAAAAQAAAAKKAAADAVAAAKKLAADAAAKAKLAAAKLAAAVKVYAGQTGWTAAQINDMIRAGSVAYAIDPYSGQFSWSTQMISPKLLKLRTAALTAAINKFAKDTGWNAAQVKSMLLEGVVTSVFDPGTYLYILNTARTTPKQEKAAVAQTKAAGVAEKKEAKVEAGAAARAASQLGADVNRVAGRTGWKPADVWGMISQQTGMSQGLLLNAVKTGKMTYYLDPTTNSFSFNNVAVTVANATAAATAQAQQLVSQGVPADQAAAQASSNMSSQLASQGIQYGPSEPTQYLAPEEGVPAEEAAGSVEAVTDLAYSEQLQYQPEQTEDQYAAAPTPYEVPAEEQPSEYPYGEPELELGPGGEFEGGGGGEFGGLGQFSLGSVSPWLLAAGVIGTIWWLKGRKK